MSSMSIYSVQRGIHRNTAIEIYRYICNFVAVQSCVFPQTQLLTRLSHCNDKQNAHKLSVKHEPLGDPSKNERSLRTRKCAFWIKG